MRFFLARCFLVVGGDSADVVSIDVTANLTIHQIRGLGSD